MVLYKIEMFLYLVIVVMCQRVSASDETDLQSLQETPEAFCQFESFRPRCIKNEVVLIKSATYGRMRIGKCVKAEEIETLGDDPRYLGCSADVSAILDRKCSGKTECEVRVYDISDENIQPCFSGLKMYLEVSYSCIAIADEKRSCIVAVSKHPTHIISSTGSVQICGTKSQPWMIEASFGQRLSIKALSFTMAAHSDYNTQLCHKYGVIVDRLAKRNASICGGGKTMEKELHLSTGNTVEIYFDTGNKSDTKESGRQFVGILRIEAVGCSDLIPPEDAWLKRSGDETAIGCYSSRHTWQLRCERGKWIGVLGNCSQQDIKTIDFFNESDGKQTLSSNGQVMAITAICGFTFVICIIIVCVGAICLRRYHVQNKRKLDYKTLVYETNVARSQPMLPDVMTYIPSGAQQQPPSCSIYLGQNDVNDVEHPVGFPKAETSDRL